MSVFKKDLSVPKVNCIYEDGKLRYKNVVGKYEKWYYKNKIHRDNDLPAVIRSNGDQEWYQNGKLHRDNDLPAIINVNNSVIWYERWYQHGKLHNTTGPARIKENGKTEYYINDKPLSEYEFMFVTGETV